MWYPACHWDMGAQEVMVRNVVWLLWEVGGLKFMLVA